MPNKKGVESQCLSNLRATTPFNTISTNDPRPKWDVSVRLTLVLIESGSFRFENKRRISKFPVAPHHSVRGYVVGNCSKKEIHGQAKLGSYSFGEDFLPEIQSIARQNQQKYINTKHSHPLTTNQKLIASYNVQHLF